MTEQVPAYTLGTPQQTTAYNEQGRAVPHMRVPMTMADGSTLHIEVPYTDGWHEAAQQAADRLYQEVQDVMQAAGPMVEKPAPNVRRLRTG